MQTTGHRQKNANDSIAASTRLGSTEQLRGRFSPLFISVVVMACLLFTMAGIAINPSNAYAKSYTMPKVDITANVATDGSLNVVEQRTFDFDGTFSAVWWTFSGLPSNASLKVNSVSLTTASGQTTQLPEESFVLSWRDSGGPSEDSYSVDAPMNTVYVFLDATDEKVMVTLDYAIVNGAQAYKDVADLYWKYVGDQWAEASDNVTMTLTLPVPEGTTVTPGENVRAWGHGPLDGTVSFNADGSILYKVGHVSSGQYAEARVVFPVEWLTDLPQSALTHTDENHLDTVLKEEQSWADQANRNRVMSLVFVIACGLIAILALIWAIRTFFKYGKEHAPEFTDEYWRDVPSPQDHPAVIARLWRWNKESANDFTATLMHLSHLGAIQINKGTYEKPGLFGSSKTVDDYYMTRVPAVADTLTSPIDREAMDFLFNEIAEGADSLWFGSIEKYGKDNAQEFVDGMTSWQGRVTAETNKRDFFELKGQQMQMVMVGVAIILAVLGVGVGIFTVNFIPLIFIIPVAIALFFIAHNMPRRSQEGSTLEAKSKALANWLKDFSALDERPPTDVKVWGEFMVYAFIFGIAKQVIEALKIKVPELFQEDGTMMSTTYVPWWFWYSPMYGSSGNVMPSAGDMLQTSINNTVSTAQSALSGASGNFSSGGGFGGGFSGGGGGGFGGGGGAR